MKKKGFLVLFSCIGLILVLAASPFISASSKPAPTAEKPFEVNILTTASGSSGYLAGFALSEIVNKYIPELKLAAIESKSMFVNLSIYMEKPEERKNTIYICDTVTWGRAIDGRDPFTKKVPGLRTLLCYIPDGSIAFMSYNPNITRPEALKGKTIGASYVGEVTEFMARGFLRHWGIFDDVRYMTIGYPTAVKCLLDGTVDVAAVPQGTKFHPEKWSSGALTAQVFAKKQTYFVNMTKEDIEAEAAESGDRITPLFLPKNSYPGAFPCPQKDTWVPGFDCVMLVDKSFDEEIAYKIVKAAIKHHDEFRAYREPFKWIKSSLASAHVEEALWHPGALRAYKEAGLKIGERAPLDE